VPAAPSSPTLSLVDESEGVLLHLPPQMEYDNFAHPSLAADKRRILPEQRKYAESNYSGAFRLSGGAGTGKTVVAIHRARRLARENPSARIILTTFNATLAQGLRAGKAHILP
jgi:hypothetical protein